MGTSIESFCDIDVIAVKTSDVRKSSVIFQDRVLGDDYVPKLVAGMLGPVSVSVTTKCGVASCR